MTPLKTRAINIATAFAVSLAAITSGGAPAAANSKNDDMLKILAGIAAVAVFAGVLNNQAQGQPPVTRNQPLFPPPEPRNPARGWQDPFKSPEWQQDRVASRGGPRLPAACAVEIGNGPRPATYYTEACLRNAGLDYGLPQFCAQQLRTQDYRGRVYEAECLGDAGYRFEHWR
jgi:hypothetical protein